LTDTISPTSEQAQEPKSISRTTATVSPREVRTELTRVVARTDPLVVAPDVTVRHALARMRERRGEPLLVVEGRRLAGILTERDVLHRILGQQLDLDGPVSAVMTAEPRTLAADAPLLEAMRQMEAGHYRNLPLVDDGGELVGVLRQQDLISYIAEAFPQEILNLPPRPHQLMEQPEGA
jgi:CBS domain-containing protein